MRSSDILSCFGRGLFNPSVPWQALHQKAISSTDLAGSPVHVEEHWRTVAAVASS